MEIDKGLWRTWNSSSRDSACRFLETNASATLSVLITGIGSGVGGSTTGGDWRRAWCVGQWRRPVSSMDGRRSGWRLWRRSKPASLSSLLYLQSLSLGLSRLSLFFFGFWIWFVTLMVNGFQFFFGLGQESRAPWAPPGSVQRETERQREITDLYR